MSRSSGSAVVVCRSQENARRIAAMLPEYDTITVSDPVTALEVCRSGAVELAVAEAVLPYTDGYGLAARLRSLDAVVRPGVVVIAPAGMLRGSDIGGCVTLRTPFDEAALREAAMDVRLENRTPAPAFTEKAYGLLDSLGIPVHCGRDYLVHAVFTVCEDRRFLGSLTGRLYPAVAARFGVSAQAVERAMRRVIEAAWNRGSIDTQYELFKDTIDAAKGKPTCGGMIAQLSEILRMEG